MSEFPLQSDPERLRVNALERLIEAYFLEDKEFLDDMEESDKLGYVYGALLQGGEDPDEVLIEFGVMERSDEV